MSPRGEISRGSTRMHADLLATDETPRGLCAGNPELKKIKQEGAEIAESWKSGLAFCQALLPLRAPVKNLRVIQRF